LWGIPEISKLMSFEEKDGMMHLMSFRKKMDDVEEAVTHSFFVTCCNLPHPSF